MADDERGLTDEERRDVERAQAQFVRRFKSGPRCTVCGNPMVVRRDAARHAQCSPPCSGGCGYPVDLLAPGHNCRAPEHDLTGKRSRKT